MGFAATPSSVPQLPFTFSLEERDRRYQRVRAMMAERGWDALLVPCNTGHNDAFQADLRYLSQIGGFANEAALIFPMNGEPTCWARADSQPAEWWRDMQDWVADVRGTRCNWSENLATSIRELGLEGGRFGVVGIGGTPRSPDGLILYGTMTRLQEWFPRAKFEDATEAMVRARESKSDEEVAALERATRIAERAVLTGAAAARPGATDQEVYAEMVASMLRDGGDLPTLILWAAGASPNRYSRLPPVRAFQQGDVLISEVEAKCVGYIAQVRRPTFLGGLSSEYAAMHALVVEAFQLMFDRMRPGVPFAELVNAYRELTTAHGFIPVAVPIHGRGLGEDLPLINVDTPPSEAMQERIKPGQVFILGPRIATKDRSKVLQWGDTVVVTEQGARRLGVLPPEPVIAGGGGPALPPL